MKRTNTRILAMMILYQYDISGEINYERIPEMSDEPIVYDDSFLHALVEGVLSNEKQINHTISRYLENYTLDRMAIVDRNLVRIGVYELMFTNTPTSIIIDQIIEISKIYSEVDQYETSKFNHALLDRIAKGIQNGK